MKIYRVNEGAIVEMDKKYSFIALDWNQLLVQKDIKKYINKHLNTGVTTKLHKYKLLNPIGDHQELWACGVTYLRSKVGRQEESKSNHGGDFYEKVYNAKRPEVFFKANPSRIVAHNEAVRIRKDSIWNVPEPELALIVSPNKKIIGYTISNDMSSRSIEGENPLYLPQAKTYDGCASLGPCISLDNPFDNKNCKIKLSIIRDNVKVFKDEVLLSQMKRKQEELVSYVFKECSFPYGCFIMTGTGIVPPNDFTLLKGDVIKISIDGIGELKNTVG